MISTNCAVEFNVHSRSFRPPPQSDNLANHGLSLGSIPRERLVQACYPATSPLFLVNETKPERLCPCEREEFRGAADESFSPSNENKPNLLQYASNAPRTSTAEKPKSE